jgi:hypothetical protein
VQTRRVPLCFAVFLLGSASLQTKEKDATPATPPPSPLVLMEATKAPLVFSWSQLKNGTATIAIFNPSAASIKVTARLTKFDRFPLEGTPSGPLSIDVSPPSTTICSYQLQTFHLMAADSAAPSPGNYAGLLIFEDPPTKTGTAPFVQQVRVAIAGPQPLLQKSAVTFWRLVPLGTASPWWNLDVSVPLADSAAAETPRGTLVGAVRNDAGNWLKVRWTEADNSSNRPSMPFQSGSRDAQLFVDPPPSAGKYEGDLTLSRDPEKIPLNLTVIAKDIVLFPILTLLLGTYLAFKVKRYLGVKRLTWSLREKEAALGETYLQSQRTFANLSRGQPFASYSISADVTALRKSLLGHLTAIEKSWSISIGSDNDDYSAAQGILQILQAGISAWPSLAEGLVALSRAMVQARAEIDGSIMEPPSDDPGSPEFFEQAEALLLGKAITLSQLPQISTDVAAQTALASDWARTVREAAGLTAEVKENQPASTASDAEKAQFTTLRTQTATLWVHLWEIKNSADLNAIVEIGGDMDIVRTHLAQMQIEFPSVRIMRMSNATNFSALLSAIESQRQGWVRGLDDLLLSANDSARAKQLRVALLRNDIASTMFAGGIGLLTGLNIFYFGKPFGTFQDYVTLFLWAAGTKAGLDILMAVLDKFAPPSVH